MRLDTSLLRPDMRHVPKRLPIIPTVIVALAVATMIGLGVWQLQRAAWKEGMLSQLEANRGLPEIAYPLVHTNVEELLFRRARAYCAEPAIRVTSGRNMAGRSGWSHLATCVTGRDEGQDITVDVGWSATHRGEWSGTYREPPPPWRGGPVRGVIVPDSRSVIRLIASTPAPGLVPSQPPGPDTIPNNHRMYALQWFFFAAAAALIYGLALRRRGHKTTA